MLVDFTIEIQGGNWTTKSKEFTAIGTGAKIGSRVADELLEEYEVYGIPQRVTKITMVIHEDPEEL